MTVTVFHGEDVITSDQALTDLIVAAKKNGTTVTRLEGKSLTVPEFLAATGQDDFFASKKIIVINRFFARPKSKIRDQLLQLILDSEAEVILWENKKLTPANEKVLLGAAKKHFPLSEKIWAFLNSFAVDNQSATFVTLYEQTLAQNDALYILAMLIWQVQQLLDIKENTFAGAPFTKKRLQTQSEKFTFAQLANWHQRLLDLDYRAKSGGLRLDLGQELLLVLLSSI
ncbi:MAG: hypothetical protein Q4G02_01410 [bacterium]|nr:hypothetical protein [bacterium]